MSVLTVNITLEEARFEKLRRLCVSNFATYVRYVWSVLHPNPEHGLVWENHTQALCDHMQAVAERRIRRPGIQIPPGCTKSLICNILYPTWCWLRKEWAGRRYISTTHTLELSYEFQEKRVAVINSERYQALNPGWALIRSAAGLIRNSFRGEVKATAVGAAITGKHSDEALIDDSLTPEGARNKKQRLAVVAYWEDTLQSRIVPREDPVVVHIAQRLAGDDLHGHFEKIGFYDCLKIGRAHV